jgi:hypothetical protein
MLKAFQEILHNYRLGPIKGLPMAEVTMGLSPKDKMVRLMGAGLGRRYDAGPGEIPGTGDFVFEDHKGIPVYLDLKTGNPRYGKEPQAAWQVKAMCSALWLATGAGQAGVYGALWYPREGMKDEPLSYGTVLRMCHFQVDTLETYCQELGLWYMYAAMVKAGQAEPEFVRGEHCKLCDARPNCPLWRVNDVPGH